MKAQQFLVTSLTSLAIAGMVFGPAVPPALAQVAAPAPGAEQPAGPEVSPNQQVGRLAWLQGSVSFHAADQDSWSPAAVNYPVSTGDGLWTEPGALAGIEVANTLIALSGGTELDVAQMQDVAYSFTLPQGELFLHVRSVQPNESYMIATPRGTVTIGTPGRYEIAAGTTQDPTVVTVLEGSAEVSGAAQATIGPGQAAVITGDQAFQVQMAAAQHDAFLNDMLARERPAVTASTTQVPVLVQQMPGGEDLSQYGSWSETPQYGQVWYPQVAAGWQPYTDGHWAWVQPYGWTWVDNDPWGFAPFHYGRWVQLGGRWAWCPASVQAPGPAYPVYAPALVTFFGVGAAFVAGAAVGALWSSGRVGWVPLGPGEAYHPWFRAAPNYIRSVNIRHVTNITNISNTTVNNVTINNYRNARAAVVVPAAAMATSRPIRAVARTADPAELRQARPVVGRSPLPPTMATAGITPAVARQVHAVAPPAGYAVPPHRTAPGPAIQPVAIEGGHSAAPVLRQASPAAAVGAARVAEPARPGGVPPGAIARPGEAAMAEHAGPALRAPNMAKAGPPPITHGPAQAAVRPETGGVRPEGIRPGAVTPEGRTEATARPALPGAVARPEQPALHPAPHPGEVAGGHAEAAARPALPPPTHPEPRAVTPEAHQPTVHAVAPPVVHAAPERHEPVHQPTVHAAAPPVVHAAPEVRTPAPEVHVAPRPEPVHVAAPPTVHAAPRPEPPPVHMAAPAPQMHAAPPPAPHPAPEMHAAAAPHPAPQQHEKKPGER